MCARVCVWSEYERVLFLFARVGGRRAVSVLLLEISYYLCAMTEMSNPFPVPGIRDREPFSENLIEFETRFALDHERPRRTGRDAGSTGLRTP